MLLVVPAYPYPSSLPALRAQLKCLVNRKDRRACNGLFFQSLCVLLGAEGHPHVRGRMCRPRTAPDEQGRGGKGEESHERK